MRTFANPYTSKIANEEEHFYVEILKKFTAGKSLEELMAIIKANAGLESNEASLLVEDFQNNASNSGTSGGRLVKYTLPNNVEKGDPEKIALLAINLQAYKGISIDKAIAITLKNSWTNTYSGGKKGDAKEAVFQTQSWLSGLKLVYAEKPHVIELIKKYEAQVLKNGHSAIIKMDDLAFEVAKMNEVEFAAFNETNAGNKNTNDLMESDLKQVTDFIANKNEYLRNENRVEKYLKTPNKERDQKFNELVHKIALLGLTPDDYKKLSEKENNTALLNIYGFNSQQEFESLRDEFKQAFLDKLAGETFKLLDENEKIVQQELQRYQANPEDLAAVAEIILNGQPAKQYEAADKKRAETLTAFVRDFDIHEEDIPQTMPRISMFLGQANHSEKDVLPFLKGTNSNEITNILHYLQGHFGELSLKNPQKQERFYKGLEKNKHKDPGLYDKLKENYKDHLYGSQREKFLTPDMGKELIRVFYPGMAEAWSMDREATSGNTDLISKYPMLADVTINFRDLAREYQEIGRQLKPQKAKQELQQHILVTLEDKLNHVSRVRENTAGNIKKAWAYETILQGLMARENIDSSDVMGIMIAEETQNQKDKDFWWSVGLAAVGIAVAIGGFITLNPYVVASGLLISAADTYQEIERYNNAKALRDTGFENQLSEVDAPLWPVVISVAGFIGDFAAAVKLFKNIARGVAALEKTLPQIYRQMKEMPGSKIAGISEKEFTQLVLSAYNQGFDAGKQAPEFMALIKKYGATMAKTQRYGQAVLYKIYEKDPALAEFIVKSCAANPEAIGRLGIQAMADPETVLNTYNRLYQNLGNDAARVFSYLGGHGRNYLPKLDTALDYLPAHLSTKNKATLLQSPEFLSEAAQKTKLLQTSELQITAQKLAKSLESSTPQLEENIRRILANGVSESDLNIILKNAQKQLPVGDRTYNLEWLLNGLQMAGNLKVPHYGLMVDMLKSEGPMFDKAMRTLAYTARKEKWDRFGTIFAAKVGNRIMNPPQGFSKESFEKLNRLILENTKHYGGKLKVQGSKLMNASDVDEFGNLISDLDYVCVVDDVGFMNALRISFNNELKPIYAKYFKEEQIGLELTSEQFERLCNFTRQDMAATKRVMTKSDRETMKVMFDLDERSIIFPRRIIKADGSKLETLLEEIKTEFGKIEFSIKRAGQYEDPPYIEIKN